MGFYVLIFSNGMAYVTSLLEGKGRNLKGEGGGGGGGGGGN
jgi:hypothetical protein